MGPTTKIFLNTELTEELATQVDAVIRSIASEVTPTQKGRDWEVMIDSDGNHESHPFHIHIWNTREHLLDCETELKALKGEASSLPTHIVFSAGCNQPEDWKILERMTKTISKSLGGIATEPEK